MFESCRDRHFNLLIQGLASLTKVRDLAAQDARVLLLIVRPLQSEGAGDAGCPMHPQPGVRIVVVSMHTSIHSGSTGNIRHPPRNGFTAYSALFPGTNCFVDPVIRATRWRLANLTPASGRQNHTASPSASGALVSRSVAATASRPANVTIACRPSVGTGQPKQ